MKILVTIDLSMGGDSVARLPLAKNKRIDSIRLVLTIIQTLENYIKASLKS